LEKFKKIYITLFFLIGTAFCDYVIVQGFWIPTRLSLDKAILQTQLLMSLENFLMAKSIEGALDFFMLITVLSITGLAAYFIKETWSLSS